MKSLFRLIIGVLGLAFLGVVIVKYAQYEASRDLERLKSISIQNDFTDPDQLLRR